MDLDHLMAHSVNPPGTLVVRRLLEGRPKATGLEVVRADPQVVFTDELLNAIRDDVSIYPDVRVEGFEEYGPHICRESTCSPDRTCFTGIRVHLDAFNRHVIYLIGDYVPAVNGWVARWPD